VRDGVLPVAPTAVWPGNSQPLDHFAMEA